MILSKPRIEDYDPAKYGNNIHAALAAYMEDNFAWQRNVRRLYVVGIVLFVAICAVARSVLW